MNLPIPLLAQIPRGTGAFIGVAIPAALVIIAACLHWIGRKSWLRSLAGAFVGFLCYPLAIGLLIWAFTSERYGELLSWSMIVGFPLILGIALLFVAWLLNIGILCWFGGWRAGLITGFAVMPLMWTLCFGSGISLLGLYEKGRESIDFADAVERGDYPYLNANTGRDQAEEVFKLSLIWMDPEAAEIALTAGAAVNQTLSLVNGIPQTPLQIALEPLTSESLKKPDRPRRQKAMIDLLLRLRADPNRTGREGDEPLLLAITRLGDPAVVKQLLNAGAKLSPERPPLHAASGRYAPESAPIVKLLLDAGAQINARRPVDQHTPLQCAALGTPETIKLLVDRGAEVRPPLATPDDAPVLISARNSRPENALLLIQLGADPLARTAGGLSAWQLSRDPALRKELEARGVPREVPHADFVPANGDSAGALFKAFQRNTSIYMVQQALAEKLPGAGPWDVRIRFPEDSAPVELKGVACIECEELGSNINGSGRIVKNSVWLGEKESPPNLQSRALEKMEPFSSQVQLGYRLVFHFEGQE